MTMHKAGHSANSMDVIHLFRVAASAALYAALAITGSDPGLLAQTGQQRPLMAQSDLARQNLSRVAASVGQLVFIFHRDPGLMMELKRWIAKDATDHGQLISDDDFTVQDIYDRMENDTFFRWVSTTLVQKYGFLTPTLNPESSAAQEQQILIRERARFIAQDEEISRNRSRQQPQNGLAQTQACDPANGDGTAQGNTGNPAIQELPSGQQPGMNGLPGGSAPDLQNVPSIPPGTPTLPAAPGSDATQLMRTSAEDSGNDQLGTGNETGQDLSQGNSQGRRTRNQNTETEDLNLSSDFAGEEPNVASAGAPSTGAGTEIANANVGSLPASEADGSSSDVEQ